MEVDEENVESPLIKLAELFPDKGENELKDVLDNSGSVENAVAAIVDGPEILGNFQCFLKSPYAAPGNFS